jgi:hypothetical protein
MFLRALRTIAVGCGLAEPDEDTAMEQFYGEEPRDCCPPEISATAKENALYFLSGIAVCVCFHSGHF